MLHVLGCITQQHDLRFVALAGLLCLFACWTAMNLLMRARLADGAARTRWTLTAGVVFGAGVWATHFIAMLAYRSEIPLGYDVPLTLFSVALAIGLSTLGFAVAIGANPAVDIRLVCFGTFIAGAAVSAMHYTGMAAIQGPFRWQWNATYIAASLLIGVGFVVGGGLAAVTIRNIRGRLLGVVLWAFGIWAMHFTGMSAASLIPDPAMHYGNAVLFPEMLSVAVCAVAFLIVTLGLVAAQLDNHLAHRRVGEAERLRKYIAELEATKHHLEATTRELNEALVAATAANVAKSDFLAAMSHELRTPLNAVIGFSEILLAESFGPLGNARYREYAGDIRTSGGHLLSLINDILDLSRLQAGQIELKESVFSMQAVVADALHMVEVAAASGRLSLVNDVPADLPAVRAGRRRLHQVILNLLSNAIKFTPPSGSVVVRAGLSDAGLYVAVCDTGIGIAEQDIPKALERFGQVDTRIARKFEGAGLGLPISVQLMKAHGGTLAIESVVDKGTTVTITLPRERIVALESAA